MASWTKATGAAARGAAASGAAATGAATTAVAGERSAGPSGLLHPTATARVSGLRREYPVHPALGAYVERYWSVSWDRVGRPPFRSEVLPDPSVNLSVEWGHGPRHGVAMPAALVHGVVTRRFVIDLRGRGGATAVKFRPGGFTAWCGHRPGSGTVTPLRDADRLVAEVLARPDDEDRVAVLDRLLADRAREPSADYLLLAGLVAEMASDRAVVRVDQVAERAGMSVRSLQRLFSAHIGVGPKRVLARYRLQDAAAVIDAGSGDDPADLAELAASLGWYDQAHFSRDFRAAIGVTPSAYLAAARALAARGDPA